MKLLESNHKFVNTILWDNAEEQKFQCVTASVEIQDLLRKAAVEITLNANMVLDSFVGCLKAASSLSAWWKIAPVVSDPVPQNCKGLDEEWKSTIINKTTAWTVHEEYIREQ